MSRDHGGVNVQSREYRHVDTILKTGTLFYFYFIFPELYHVYWRRIRLMVVRRLAAFPRRSYIEFEVSIATIIASL